MPRVRDTAEVRAVLREWAEGTCEQSWAERAHEAYMSTQADADGFSVLVDDEMLHQLRQREDVQRLDEDEDYRHTPVAPNMAERAHILVVDDDADVRDVIAKLLATLDYRATVAVGGEALRTALDGPDPIDVIVLDTNMPGEPSATLARHAMERGVRVVMVSGSPDHMKFHYERDLQLLTKPFRRAELHRAVQHALESDTFGQRGADPE